MLLILLKHYPMKTDIIRLIDFNNMSTIQGLFYA